MRRKIALYFTFFIVLSYTIFLNQDIIFEYFKEFYVKFTPKPKISVLLSSYNMGEYLPFAIDSIIHQTYTDWEMVVINDGSTDRTKENLRKYRMNPKIRTITNRKNIGLIPSLNKGLKRLRGEFIARMDADDISYPDRFERSILLMERENLDFVGAWCREGKRPYNIARKDVLNTYSIGMRLLNKNLYCQSATMARKSFLDKHNIVYNPEYLNAEDYDYYMQVFLHGGKMAYMGGKPLSIYHRTSHSVKWFRTQNRSARKIRARALATIIPNYDKRLHKIPRSELMQHVIEGNKKTKIFNQDELIKCQETKCYSVFR